MAPDHSKLVLGYFVFIFIAIAFPIGVDLSWIEYCGFIPIVEAFTMIIFYSSAFIAQFIVKIARVEVGSLLQFV